MHSFRRRAVGAVAAAAAALGAGTAVLATATPASAAPAPLTTKVLADSFARYLAAPTSHIDGDLASIAPDRQLTVGVWIPGDTAGLEAYARAVGTTGSPQFGQQLTPSQVEQRFGVSQAVSGEVQQLLRGDGLQPVYVAHDGEYVELKGSVAQVERTFAVHLLQFTSGGRTWFANAEGATVPSAVGAVLGLTDTTRATTAATQTACGDVPNQCVGAVFPGTVADAYGLPALGGAGSRGQGEKVAVFGEGDLSTVVASLRWNETHTTLDGGRLTKPLQPKVPVREVLVDDPQNANADTAGSLEWDLDSQSITDMSPYLSELDFYFGNDLTDQSINGVYSAWVNDAAGPAVGNSSFGGCEPLEYASGGSAVQDALLAKAVSEGRSMFASSGDGGAGCQFVANAGQPGPPGTQMPASSPFVTAVGGTVLYTAAASGAQVQPPRRATEYGWTNSGGGYATFEAMPSDQASALASGPTAVPTPRTCVDPVSGKPVTCREVPDVAALSGDAGTNAVYIVQCASTTENPCSEGGGAGTSVSSPLWAGMWAAVRSAHQPSAIGTCMNNASSMKADLGFARPDLYDVAATNDAAYYDIGGATGSAPSDNFAYPTLPKGTPGDPTGYDLVTGLGSPNVDTLMKSLDCEDTTTTPVPAPPAASDPAVSAVQASATQPSIVSTCPNDGSASKPAGGAAFTGDPGLDIVAGKVTGDATQAVFTIDTAGAAATPADAFTYLFSYGGRQYGVSVDPSGGNGYGDATTLADTPVARTPGTPAYDLFTLTPVTAPVGTLAFVPQYLASLQGSATGARHYSMTLPYATFNTAAAKVTGFVPMQQGSTLQTVEILSGVEPTFAANAAQQVDADGLQFPCPVTLGAATATGPTAALPDASVPAGMVALGAAAGGGLLLRRRRRR